MAAPGAVFVDVAGVLLLTGAVLVILLLASAGDKAGSDAGLWIAPVLLVDVGIGGGVDDVYPWGLKLMA